jgi:hypothetical protein
MTEQPVDEPIEITAGSAVGSITLTNHTLGLDPYVLIRAVKTAPEDADDDGLRLKVEHNDDGAALATLFVLNLPADQNPITAAIKAVIDANPDDQAIVEALHLFAQFCDVPMPESGK